MGRSGHENCRNAGSSRPDGRGTGARHHQNAAGTAGANFGDGTHASGIGNGGVTDQAVGSFKGIADGGYWEVTPVPLPAGLPLLLTGLSAFGLFGSSKRRSVGADL